MNPGFCSECQAALKEAYPGSNRFLKTCGKLCDQKRKTRLQAERRRKAWEVGVMAEGKTPLHGFFFPLDCLRAALLKQTGKKAKV